jgi:hypothetical protein
MQVSWLNYALDFSWFGVLNFQKKLYEFNFQSVLLKLQSLMFMKLNYNSKKLFKNCEV